MIPLPKYIDEIRSDLQLVESLDMEVGSIRLYDNNIVESTIKKDVVVDVQFLLSGKVWLEKLRPGEKFYILNQSPAFHRVTKEARRLSANAAFADHLAAIALIIGHPTTKLILDLFLKIDKPVTPLKPFTDKEAALKWLLERKAFDTKK
ncbi:MAG TPA: hypothetical protein VGF30_15645 [Bacteroidia bacterium]